MAKVAIIPESDFVKIVQYIMNIPISPSLAGKCIEVQQIISQVKVSEIAVQEEKNINPKKQ